MKLLRSLTATIVCSVLFLSAPAIMQAAPKAPAFSAVSVTGKATDTKQLAGKTYIVNFFASWCPPCRAEIPDMVALQNKYSKKGFTFVGIAVNEDAETIRSFITKNKINYPVVMATPELVDSYNRYVQGGLRGIPTSFVVNSSGEITQVISGGRSYAEFEKIILGAMKKSTVAAPKK
jgi:thiol-disulfide isomerase/thioredoxin